MVTIKVEISTPLKAKPALGVSLRVEFGKLQFIRGYIGQKRDVMQFVHRMGNGDKLFVLNGCDGNGMCVVQFFCLLRGKGDAAAANQRFAGGMDDVAAEWTDVEFRTQ